jgi:sugar lactone lactonase YvrE
VDFTPDGAAYVCSIHGDVWRVTGINEKLGQLAWKRFATGLFQPLGLKVRDGEIFVLGRDQITRLHDENGDGEADYYENFCNLIETSTSGHSYVTSLEKDDAGNFYYVDPRGAHRVSRDGRRMETLATGFRNPNGLGASPDGKLITVAPQQGEWTPSSEICLVQPGAYYGFGGPRIAPGRPMGYDDPLCWIPHSVDNSSGSQVWVPAGQWGALGGQMLHLLWGRCGLMMVLRDVVEGVSQGAVLALPGHFLSGPNRGSFNPKDGQLYIAGSTGWQTSAVKDGALQRVRFTGKAVRLPIGWHAHSNGITLSFTEPLDKSIAEDPGSYAVHQWNYKYAAQYGSKDWSVADPSKEGHDEVPITAARLLEEGKTVFLEMPNLRPVMQMEIKYNLKTASAAGMRSQLWLTLNRLDKPLP